jgi:hypothetical protein
VFTHDELKDQAEAWLIAGVIAATVIACMVWLLGPRSVHDAGLSMCNGVALFGASMMALDLRLRLGSKCIADEPRRKFQLLDRAVGLGARGIPAWIAGVVLFAARLSLSVIAG